MSTTIEAHTQEAFAAAVAQQRAAEHPTVPHVVDGEELFTGALLRREDPSHPGLTVSACHDAPAELVTRAIAASRRAQREWRRVPLAERVERVRRAIPFVEARLDEWAVRVALETGKPHAGARGEGAEVLEILRFYTRYAAAPKSFEDVRETDPSGAANDSVLKPYGVFGVITPFNYPIVQAAGPTVGALLAGNGVVIKTSHHGPWSGHAVHELCQAMDLPTGLVNVVHGADEPGRALAASDVDGISFTGSVAVGQSIVRAFAASAYYRPVIAEMGGKNPVVVTDTADLELAADGIVFSAFDLSGQKCSALSRVLVTPGARDRLVDLVEDRVRELKASDPIDADAFSGPVISTESITRYERVLAAARAQDFRITTGTVADGDGYFVPATVVSGVPADHDLATVEHFLPLLTISEVATFEEGLRVANATDMGLTAGVYTGELEEARRFLDEIEAGCVDVNVPGHATTGWWPGPQTFGGWKGSGTTGKQTLGKWYFQQFARQQARKVSADLADLLTY
ncbi:aldehyde dehydrogenase family protein [Kineococcus aurantiacus]|uniref:L-glutamate gamma-semialdehyde dehydrogenase n=1 Tax=Kineococcus aurantiacus TaxID=37633 RepID=A0A7Y9J3A8_9ACTN|nr:aldehyde dehydrogenase family protein [Kineococcus aurantiacus]NYD25131.1 1-pyrroline-5-carboxylate dehydrogenase [Kineococcus aurantiacus]